MQPTEQLLTTASVFCAARDMSKSRLSTILFNDGKKFGLIEAGGDLGTKTYTRAMRWLSDNWPANTEWPEGVHRPVPSEEAA